MTEISGKRSAQVLFELAELTALMSSHLVEQQQQLHLHTNAIEHLKAQNFAQECAIQALLGTCTSVETVAERYLKTRETVTDALDKHDAQAFQAAFEPYARLLSALSSTAPTLND